MRSLPTDRRNQTAYFCKHTYPSVGTTRRSGFGVNRPCDTHLFTEVAHGCIDKLFLLLKKWYHNDIIAGARAEYKKGLRMEMRREVLRQGRPPLQLAVVQVKLFSDFPPTVCVKIIISASFVRCGLLLGGQTRRLSDPHLFLGVISPFSVVPVDRTERFNNFQTDISQNAQ